MSLILGANAWIRLAREVRVFETDVERDHVTLGRGIRAPVLEVWRREGEGKALQLIDAANTEEADILIRWVWLEAPPDDPHGSRIPADILAPLKPGSPVHHRSHTSEGTKVVSTALYALAPDGRPGAVELSEDLDTESAYIRDTVLQTVIATALLILTTALVVITSGAVLVDAPVRKLIDKARRIGSGDLEGPVTVGSSDEMEELAREINAMCENLRRAQAELSTETEARLRAMRQVRQADRLMTVGQLAAGLAHELGTPIQIVQMRTRMIERGEVDPEDVTENARLIAAQTERMSHIIRQLLDFARPRAPLKVRTDLSALVTRTASLLEPIARKQGKSIDVISASPTLATVDPDQFQQVLTNLLLNALHASRSGGCVRVDVTRNSDEAVLRVSDDGDGIAPDALVHLFEPFFTTKPHGEGTGLGLSVAHGIVQEHGGRIEVESPPGQGATFRIHLSIAPETNTGENP
jgi:signal transduction histidine kinase